MIKINGGTPSILFILVENKRVHRKRQAPQNTYIEKKWYHGESSKHLSLARKKRFLFFFILSQRDIVLLRLFFKSLHISSKISTTVNISKRQNYMQTFLFNKNKVVSKLDQSKLVYQFRSIRIWGNIKTECYGHINRGRITLSFRYLNE